MAPSTKYNKHYLPLESNPVLFTQIIHTLGAASLEFRDVLSLDDAELLRQLPRPAYALTLVFPTTENYDAYKAEKEARREVYEGCGDGEPVLWFRQTINNACGLYAILHAVGNGEARERIAPSSPLAALFSAAVPLDPSGRAHLLESSAALEQAHTAAAKAGDSQVPESAEDEVDYHYVCFVRSHSNGHLYGMDGDSKGPTDLGAVLGDGEDLLSENALRVVRGYVEREGEGNWRFGLMVLVPSGVEA